MPNGNFKIQKYCLKCCLILCSFISVGASCEEKQPISSGYVDNKSGNGTAIEDPREELYKNLHSESECAAKQQHAYHSHCIDKKGLRTMQVLRAAPVCVGQKFSHWVSCAHQALREISEVLDNTGVCSNDNLSGNCALETVQFLPKSASSKSLGQRIMVMEADIEDLAILRYGSKVLDILRTNSDGTYESSLPSSHVPKGMKTILSDILDKNYPWMSPRSLIPIRLKYSQKLKAYYTTRHGDPILTQLAELLPKAEFILVSDDTVPIKLIDEICDDEERLPDIRNFVRNLTQSLTKKINDYPYPIDYINMSFGHDVNRILSRRTCKTRNIAAVEITKIYLEEFYRPLMSLNGTTLVQASLGSPYELKPVNWEDLSAGKPERDLDYRKVEPMQLNYLTDCVEIPNRLRVDAFSYLGYGIPSFGSNNLSLLFDRENGSSAHEKRSAFRCIDIFINNGVIDSKFGTDDPIIVTPIELWKYSQWLIDSPVSTLPTPYYRNSSSYVVPLAIAYLIELKRTNPHLSPTELVTKAKEGGKFKDPLRYELHLFNVFGSDDFCDVGACEEESPAIKKNSASGRVDAVL